MNARKRHLESRRVVLLERVCLQRERLTRDVAVVDDWARWLRSVIEGARLALRLYRSSLAARDK